MLERDIFIEAIQKETPAQRAEYLHSACGADSELRLRVERLLVDHDRQNTCLVDSGAPAFLASAVQAAAAFAEPGSSIGPYKLLEPIGEGGYGVVYMAEQTKPVQRRVALKIIKAGMDSKQVVARFEAERQALALMDHPNIAKVFDAGVTEAGRPYFVMELVKGVPITKYCDEHRLTPRQRVELFVQVCLAVQHAHQKGIIHRDIKPTNVLIARYDGKPVPKVIDFGVAKATGQRLTDATMFTGFGDVIGTPQYMSPEQAELNQLDVDTRSDIYSLGVLLYELLTGTTPLESKRVREVALLEVLRAVREEEPPRPSARLTTSAELPAIAAHRGLEPGSLGAAVKGELDWIVMKALEKDRSRRYETANGFAADVHRYLNDEPVLACPPSVAYRVSKFVHRHRAGVGVATVAAVLILVVAGGIGWNVRDRAAKRLAVERDVQTALHEAATFSGSRNWPEALASVQRAQGLISAGSVNDDLRRQVAELQEELRIVARFEEIRLARSEVTPQQSFDMKSSDPLYAREFQDLLGKPIEQMDAKTAGARLGERAVAAELAAALDDWAYVRHLLGMPGWEHLADVATATDPDPLRSRVRAAWRRQDLAALTELAESEQLLAMSPPSLVSLGKSLEALGAPDKGLSLLRRARWQHPDDFWTNYELAVALDHLSPVPRQEKIRYLTAAAAVRPHSPGIYFSLGYALAAERELQEAEAAYREALRLKPDYPVAMFNLGWVIFNQRRDYEAAISLFKEVIRLEPEKPLAYESIAMLERERGGQERAITALRALADAGRRSGAYWKVIGTEFQHGASWSDAAAALEKSVQFGSGDDPSVRFSLAIAEAHLGSLEQGREHYDRGVALVDRPYMHSAVLRHMLIEAASLLRVEDVHVAVARGREDILSNRWEDAHREYAALQDWANSGDKGRWFEHACVDLMVGDVEGYRQLCQRIVPPEGAAVDGYDVFVVARTCALRADSMLGSTRLQKAAEILLAKEQYAWSLHVAGLAYYRAGDFDKAIEVLRRSNAQSWEGGAKALNWLVLALAHHRLHQDADAREDWKTAMRLINEASGNAAHPVAIPAPDWAEIQVLLREVRDALGDIADAESSVGSSTAHSAPSTSATKQNNP